MTTKENNKWMNRMNSQKIFVSSSREVSQLRHTLPKVEPYSRLLLNLLMSMFRVWDEAGSRLAGQIETVIKQRVKTL